MEQQLDRNPITPDTLQYDSASDERDIKDEHIMEDVRGEDDLDMNPTPNLYETVEEKENSFQGDVINNNNNINTDNGVNDGSENREIIWDLKTSIRTGEQQNKVVTENIEKVENHFPQMVQDINLYTVRSAKLRDAGDMFSKSLRDYAATEVPSLQRGLGAFAECFAAVQDHRNALVTRLENKVVQGFTVYETRCKQARLDVRQHTSAHNKELKEHKSFENVKAKSTQQFALAKAETKFKKAAEEANRSANILKDQISDFERQKTRDLKKVFGEFMLSEMMFYTKALEIYTRAYQKLHEIDEDESIDQLHQSLKFSTPQIGDPSPVGGSGGAGYMYGGSAPSLMTSPQPASSSMYQQQQQMRTASSNPQLEQTF